MFNPALLMFLGFYCYDSCRVEEEKIPSDCWAPFGMHEKKKTECDRALMSFGKLFSE